MLNVNGTVTYTIDGTIQKSYRNPQNTSKGGTIPYKSSVNIHPWIKNNHESAGQILNPVHLIVAVHTHLES